MNYQKKNFYDIIGYWAFKGATIKCDDAVERTVVDVQVIPNSNKIIFKFDDGEAASVNMLNNIEIDMDSIATLSEYTGQPGHIGATMGKMKGKSK